MRVILLLSFLIPLFNSCSGPQTVARDEIVSVSGFDFTDYAEKGFLFTPESYSGNYQSMGLITVTLWPKVAKKEVVERTRNR